MANHNENLTRGGTVGLAGFGALSVTDTVNGLETGGVSFATEQAPIPLTRLRSIERRFAASPTHLGRCSSNSK